MRTSKLVFAAMVALACGGKDSDVFVIPDGVVTATLSSVTLAQDCGLQRAAPPAESDFVSGACAPDANGDSDCQSLCRQSAMQLAFGNTGPDAARIAIKEVRLLDPVDGRIIERLSSREPQQWSIDKYVSWDEKLRPGELKASYKLSAPHYELYSNGTSRLAWNAKYKVEVDVEVNGVVRTLTIEATREPEVVT